MKNICKTIFVLSSFSASLWAADPPTENQGANALAAKVREQSKGLLRMIRFAKTNGQKATFNGVDFYIMDCSADVVANQECAMTGFQIGGGWDGSFAALPAQKNASTLDAFNPSGAAFGTNKQLGRNQQLTFTTKLEFDLTERGWRIGGTLPPNTPFVPDKAPEPPPEVNAQQSEKQQLSSDELILRDLMQQMFLRRQTEGGDYVRGILNQVGFDRRRPLIPVGTTADESRQKLHQLCQSLISNAPRSKAAKQLAEEFHAQNILDGKP